MEIEKDIGADVCERLDRFVKAFETGKLKMFPGDKIRDDWTVFEKNAYSEIEVIKSIVLKIEKKIDKVTK